MYRTILQLRYRTRILTQDLQHHEKETNHILFFSFSERFIATGSRYTSQLER